ncbi:hypothetical protein BKA83DRAFT_4263393 [Pisolithus microcarpus]|nr:hypothetical protein BKA83DRAFT_4263393 [Pisolithus microcarpus]
MEAFEDDNPFENDVDRLSSEASSTSRVNISAPSSPPPSTAHLVSPTISHQSRPFPSPGTSRQPQPMYKSDFCCNRDRWLHSGGDVEILITDAQKTTVHSTTPYIVYVIQAGTAEARHRYSEFESLQSSLRKLYPTLIIPPIPSKQSISDYATNPSKAKEDTFLNRIARHPILSNEHVFHRFLDGEVSWHSPPLLLHTNPTDQSVSPAYEALPNPSATYPLRHPEQRFIDSEMFTNKFANHLNGPMEKVSRRMLKRWSESAHDYSELGAALNGFSLNESGALASAIEKTGQAVDATYMSTTRLLQELEQNWAEPLHEYTQFASIIKKLLVYRHQKHVQYEMTKDTLENKRELLEEYEKSEREAKRLEEAGLARGREPASAYLPPHPEPNPYRRRAPGMGFLNALSYTLHGMMDVDPETARRNGISKTRETISQLEDALHLAAQDLKYSGSTIQADLDRFQRQKVADLREMTISMARSHRDWCKKNLETWQAAKREIEKIPDHPNSMPATQSGKGAAGPSNTRRDSSATVNGR